MQNISQAARLFISLGQFYWGKDKNKPAQFNPSQTINALKKEFASLKLDKDDIILIASAFYHKMNEERNISAMDVLGDLSKTAIEKLSNLDRIRTLILKRVFEPDEKKYRRRDSQSHKVELQIDRINVLEINIRLHPQFMGRLLGEKAEDPDDIETPYKDNKEYLQDWFSYVDVLRGYNCGRQSGWDEESLMVDLVNLSLWEKRLAVRTQNTEITFPFQEMVEYYELDHNEQVILIHMLKEELNSQPCSVKELLEVISEDKFDHHRHTRYFERDATLIKHNLIEISERLYFKSNRGEIQLFPDVSSRILRATPKNDEERIVEIIRGDDIFTVMDPKQGIDQLVLLPALKETLATAITQCGNDVGNTLHKWGLDNGIFGKDGREFHGYKPSILLLFYGPPGTGKTFAAGAVAKALGKKLLVTDISQVLSSWVGESEKNVRSIFSQYERIVKMTENPPVLLLNECDQFLGARGKAERSVDKMYNQMQNLFLEAFECFQGALIATTNLLDNLDSAFSRRFTLKLEFPLPDAEARRKLWEIHLPATIPLADDVDCEELSRAYALSGGQIAVVVKNAAVEAAQDTAGRLTGVLLHKYAKLEAMTAFGGRKINKMGFNHE